MGWNSTTKKMTKAIGIGDISKAVGSASRDLGTLIKDGPVINKFAKYKPFIYAAWGFANDNAWKTALRQTRYGFCPENGHIAPSVGTTWTYNRPQGGSSQPFRALDFDGYYSQAPCPFKMEVEIRKGTGSETSAKGGIGIMLSVNNAVSSGWDTDYCMGIKDFFDAANTSGSDSLWTSYKIAFKVENKTRGSTYEPTLYITNSTLSSVFTNAPQAYFYFPEVTTLSEWNYSGLLEDSREGDEMEVVALLYSYNGTFSHDYIMYTGNDAAVWTSGFSLAFSEGIDTVVTPVMSMYSISGTTGSITSVTNTDNGIVTPTQGGASMPFNSHAFLPTINLSINTTGASSDWSTLPNGLGVGLLLTVTITANTNSVALFAPVDNNIDKASYETMTGNTYTWRQSVQLANNNTFTRSVGLITPSKEIAWHQYPTGPDQILVGCPTTGPNVIKYTVTAVLEKGAETINLGTSSEYTLTY